MREFADLLDSLREDIHKSAIPLSVQRWIAGDVDPSEVDADTKVWVDALTTGIARAAIAAHHPNPTAEDEAAWLRSDRNLACPETRALLADYIATRDPRSWRAFVQRVTASDAQHQHRTTHD